MLAFYHAMGRGENTFALLMAPLRGLEKGKKENSEIASNPFSIFFAGSFHDGGEEIPVRPSLAFRSVRSSDSRREEEEEKEEEETKIIDSVIKKGRGKRKKSRGIVVVVGQKSQQSARQVTLLSSSSSS